MEKFTEKEKGCLTQYTSDLLKLMEEEQSMTVSDNRYTYTKQEIEILAVKVETIND